MLEMTWWNVSDLTEQRILRKGVIEILSVSASLDNLSFQVGQMLNQQGIHLFLSVYMFS